MRKKLLNLVAAAALIAAPSRPTAAQAFIGAGCTGNTFLFCASWTGTIIGGNTLQLSVTNTSGGPNANNPNIQRIPVPNNANINGKVTAPRKLPLKP